MSIKEFTEEILSKARLKTKKTEPSGNIYIINNITINVNNNDTALQTLIEKYKQLCTDMQYEKAAEYKDIILKLKNNTN